MDPVPYRDEDTDVDETRDWLESLDSLLERSGPARVSRILRELQVRAHQKGVRVPFTANTPYINTIPVGDQTGYNGIL